MACITADACVPGIAEYQAGLRSGASRTMVTTSMLIWIGAKATVYLGRCKVQLCTHFPDTLYQAQFWLGICMCLKLDKLT